MAPMQIAVVGGGPAGSAAAYRLKTQGHDVALFEKAPAIGGRLYTHHGDGFYLDTGAAFLTNRHYPRLHALAAEAGFEDLIYRMNRITALFEDAKTEPLNIGSVVSFLRYRFMTMPQKLKTGLWTLGMSRKRNVYDLGDPESLSDIDVESIAEFARRRLGEDIYNYMVRPSIEPFWYTPCEQVSAAMFLGLTARAPGAKFFCVAGGIDQICHRFAAGADVRCDSEVLDITPNGERLTLTYRDGSGESCMDADRVVVAGTAKTAAKLTASLPETLVSDTQKDYFASQEYASNIHTCFRIPRMVEAPPVNAIFPVGAGPHPWAALAFHRAKDSGKEPRDSELISLYLSGPESARMMDEPDERLFESGLGFARMAHSDIPADAVAYYLARRSEAIPIQAVGRYRLAAGFLNEQRARRSPIRFCGDYLSSATIEGAVSSALAAVEAI